eukprot:6209843-Pleurochrysis_carterae.AAC.1
MHASASRRLGRRATHGAARRSSSAAGTRTRCALTRAASASSQAMPASSKVTRFVPTRQGFVLAACRPLFPRRGQAYLLLCGQ